jgi:hypothetical protein
MTHEDLSSCGVHIDSKTQLGQLLEQLHPHVDWTNLYVWKGRYHQQRHLERIVSALFEVDFGSLMQI